MCTVGPSRRLGLLYRVPWCYHVPKVGRYLGTYSCSGTLGTELLQHVMSNSYVPYGGRAGFFLFRCIVTLPLQKPRYKPMYTRRGTMPMTTDVVCTRHG